MEDKQLIRKAILAISGLLFILDDEGMLEEADAQEVKLVAYAQETIRELKEAIK